MKSFVISLVLLFIGGAFTWWINQDRYDVRYTLSEKIPLSFGSGQKEAVQQLEVKNLTNKEVTKVQVKLPPRVLQHELAKNSQADTAEIFPSQDSFELLYAALPPQGAFRLLLKTTGVGILKQEVQVRHSRGSAQEALTDVSFLQSISGWITIGFWLFYVGILLLQFRSMEVNHWERRAGYESEKVLRAGKPFYIAPNRWKEIRDEAIDKFVEFPRYGKLSPSDITGSLIYRYLDTTKPDYLSEEEWQHFQQIKTKHFLEALHARITGTWSWLSTDELLQVLKVKKPTYLPSDQWDAWCDKLQEHFIARAFMEDPFHDNVEAKLQQAKPDEISNKRWTAYQDKLAERWFTELSTKMVREHSPLEFLERQNLKSLKSLEIQSIRYRAYQLQLSSLPDLTHEEHAQRFLQDAKPAWLSDIDYSHYRAVAERTVRVAEGDRQNTVESEKIARESAELQEVKEKVLRQLDILHKLFVDPASIERIETYDNPFASGNLEVLKRIAIALRDSGELRPSTKGLM